MNLYHRTKSAYAILQTVGRRYPFYDNIVPRFISPSAFGFPNKANTFCFYNLFFPVFGKPNVSPYYITINNNKYSITATVGESNRLILDKLKYNLLHGNP